jgi:hypothetical protein
MRYLFDEKVLVVNSQNEYKTLLKNKGKIQQAEVIITSRGKILKDSGTFLPDFLELTKIMLRPQVTALRRIKSV